MVYCLLTFPACATPLGLENGQLHSSYLSASGGSFGRIKFNNNQFWSTWNSKDSRDFVQVTLTPYGKTVTALALQGESRWVTSFTLSTSEDGTEWKDYIVQGKVKVFGDRVFSFILSFLFVGFFVHLL